MNELEDAAGLRALARNRQMPDNARPNITLGELRAALHEEWRDHIPSGYEDQTGYGQVSCSCGWDSGGAKLVWEDHIDAAERDAANRIGEASG